MGKGGVEGIRGEGWIRGGLIREWGVRGGIRGEDGYGR